MQAPRTDQAIGIGEVQFTVGRSIPTDAGIEQPPFVIMVKGRSIDGVAGNLKHARRFPLVRELTSSIKRQLARTPCLGKHPYLIIGWKDERVGQMPRLAERHLLPN